MDRNVIVHKRDLTTGWQELKQGENENKVKQVWGSIELLIWTY